MHAVIVGLSDETYDKLGELCMARLDPSWLATRLLEQAIGDAPAPGTCKACGEIFFRDVGKRGHPRAYCSEPCRDAGYRARKVRYWRKKGLTWRKKRAGSAVSP